MNAPSTPSLPSLCKDSSAKRGRGGASVSDTLTLSLSRRAGEGRDRVTLGARPGLSGRLPGSFHMNFGNAALGSTANRIGGPAMDIPSHMEKAARMDAVHRRLDREADFELWYWMALDAANQAMNAALHAAGVTAEEPELASQVNDIYMRRTGTGEWERVVRRGADIIHPQMSEFDRPVPEELRDAIGALHTLEGFRDPCIRLGREATPEIADTCAEAYEKVLAVTRDVVARARSAP